LHREPCRRCASEDDPQKARARFNEWSETYDDNRISAWFRHYQSLALGQLGLEGGSRLLDVGCGTGWAVRQAAERLESGSACGIDIAPGMIEKARAQNSRANVEFRVSSSEAIPYPDGSFSHVLCTFSFHHYAKPLQALSEIRRVLQQGGRLSILDSARDVSLAIWLQDRWRRYLERSHVRYYTIAEMQALLRQARFTPAADVLTFKKFRDHHKLFTGLALHQWVK
jgi:ubiquinone/menaquinone biosynthesis C-methylase UbiE